MEDETEATQRILIVDRDQGLCEACRRVLSRQGYPVEVVATAREGLSRVRSGDFALVLLDVATPDNSGIEAAKSIRAHDERIVCVLTGYDAAELAATTRKLRAYGFIAKPCCDDHLLLMAERGLEKRRLEQEACRAQQWKEEIERLSQEKGLLEELDRAESASMRKVAHELRAPLSAIRSFLTLILQGYVSPEKARHMQQRAAERADELLVLIDDILNLAHLKGAGYPGDRELVSVEAVLRDVLALHAPETEERRLKLKVEARPCAAILADPAHIQQLWTNLISNAIKYTPKGGRVTVRLFPEGGTIVGEVSDTGIGIAREDLPHLFEEFFRTAQAKEFAQRGTGLGLSIVKQIVQQYGGDICVESRLGKGSRFTFVLPVGGSAPAV
jgi:signal transduction histidine kinase